MVWYYADSDRQRGPVSDEEFQEMISTGRVRNDTLIWKDGMDNWLPLSSARDAGLITFNPASVPGLPPIPPTDSPLTPVPSGSIQSSTICSQCGASPLTSWNSVQLGQIQLCHKCNAQMARYYQEKANTPSTTITESLPPAESNVGTDIEYASIFERAGAALIDKLIQSIILTIELVIAGDPESMTEASNAILRGDFETAMQMMQPLMIAALVFEFFYHFALIAFCGASLGKMIFKVRVTNPDGEPASVSQAFLRALLPFIMLFPITLMPRSELGVILQFAFYVGIGIAFFDFQKRTIYDHFARTRVLRN